MNNKIINLEKIIKEKKINCSKNNMIFDLLNLTEVIQNKINEIYDIGEKYKGASGKCTDEQMKLFSKIVCSYFRILFDEIDNYTGSTDENRVLYNFASNLDEICINLPSIEEIMSQKEKRVRVPNQRNYTIDDILTFPETIENKINEIYDIGAKNEEYRLKCTEEQIRIFIKIVCSYFRILFDEIDNYNETDEQNGILYNFLEDLRNICDNLPDLQKIIKDDDKRVLRLENTHKNNV